VDPGGQMALEDWLMIRGDAPGALFLRVHQNGRIAPFAQGQYLTAQAVYNMLARRGRQAGLAAFSPHDFRRTVIGDLLDAGVDIATVARMMGHADIKTTKRYDRRPEQVRQAAAGKIHLPYRRRSAPE
jgi:integrase